MAKILQMTTNASSDKLLTTTQAKILPIPKNASALINEYREISKVYLTAMEDTVLKQGLLNGTILQEEAEMYLVDFKLQISNNSRRLLSLSQISSPDKFVELYDLILSEVEHMREFCDFIEKTNKDIEFFNKYIIEEQPGAKE